MTDDKVKMSFETTSRVRLEFNLACKLLGITASDVFRDAMAITINQVRIKPDGDRILDAALSKVLQAQPDAGQGE